MPRRRAVGGFVAAAVCTLRVTGMLIPPTVEKLDESLYAVRDDTKDRVFDLPCLSCGLGSSAAESNVAVFRDADHSLRAQEKHRNLALHFRVCDDTRELTVNGTPIFPTSNSDESDSPSFGGFMLHVDPSADFSADGLADEAIPFHFTVKGDPTISPTSLAFVEVQMQISGWRGRLAGQERVVVDLAILPTGELIIIDVASLSSTPDLSITSSKEEAFPMIPEFEIDAAPYFDSNSEPKAISHSDTADDCATLPRPLSTLCELKETLSTRLHSLAPSYPGRHFKPCPGSQRYPQFPSAPPSEQDSGLFDISARPKNPSPHFHRGRPHHMRPWNGPHGHHHHRHHLHYGSMIQSFARWTIALLVPIVVGLTAGVSACLLGLALGWAISFLWRVLVRGGQRSDSEEDAELATGPDVVDEKFYLKQAGSTIMESDAEGALPRYTDVEAASENAPAYQPETEDAER